MSVYTLFAFTQLNVDPEISKLFLWIFGIIFATAVFYIAFHIIKYSIARRILQDEADRKVHFESSKSILRRSYRNCNLPDNSLEFFVCKLVFGNPDEPQLDLNVLEAAGKYDNDDLRAVEQAVRRVNKKAKDTLQLKGDLLLRRKEKTFLNEIDNLV